MLTRGWSANYVTDIGYFCLTAISGAARAVVLDRPDAAVEEDLT